MPTPTDVSIVSEHDSPSDSDWLDIAGTDRDSDDNDSIYSSRETDHEHFSRSRSRRSSLSYGSSRDGDVDAWEGLIDDNADEGMPDDVHAHHVFSQHPLAFNSDPAQDVSPEELRVREGLDQSMLSTLSSSRSSSLHASTIHNSSRDLRLSFPDPITSSCREPLSTSYEEIQPNSETLPTPADPHLLPDQADDEELLSASQMSLTELRGSAIPSSSTPELKVFLYGAPTPLKWSIINRLLQKVVHGAGLTITPDIDNLHESIRRLTVTGSFEHDRAFPRIVTIFDRTLESQNTVDDPALVDFSGIHPLVVVFLPCGPLRLPEHAPLLPVLVSSPYGAGCSQSARELRNIPLHRTLRITAPRDTPVVDKDSIDVIDSARAYRAFSRLWHGDNGLPKGWMASTHALTIIAILSLVLGLVVRAAIPFSPPFVTFNSNCTWQMLRLAPYRERLAPSTTVDNSVVVMPSAFKELSLSVFGAESTSMTLARTNPTDFRRIVSSTLSEHSTLSKDLMLQPPHSVLPPDDRSKALSVIPESSPTTSYQPGPTTTGDTVSALVHTSVPDIVKECASVATAIVNQDMQDILDALDALVQAISRQTQVFLTQATRFVEQSAMQLKTVEPFEAIKETLHGRNERARKRAKEIREMGTKWLHDASEAITSSAQFSKGMAWEMAEGLAHRAQHARGKAKKMAAGIQDFVNEYERLDELVAWDVHTKHWVEWVERVKAQGRLGKPCKTSKRKLQSAIFC